MAQNESMMIVKVGFDQHAIGTLHHHPHTQASYVSKGKFEAKNIFNQVREKALRDINAKKEVLDKQIDDEIRKAEQEIKSLRDSAPDKINKIAIETSAELIQKLIGAEVNNSSISAIVDDLSKRNGDKYYGN